MNKQEFIVVLIVTFGVVMIWVTSDIAHNSSTFTPDPKIKGILEDKISPNFDQSVLKNVNSAATPAPTTGELSTPVPTGSSSPTPKPSATAKAGAAATVLSSPSPSSSSSGTLR